MSEEFNDIYISEAVDSKEYDYEGDMAKTQLVTIADAAEELHDLLEDDENMPEWCQNKITKAMDYLDTVRDYMISKDTEEEPGDENPNEAVVNEGNMASAAKELEAYARKSGGIDKNDFMKAVMLMKRNQSKQLNKFVDELDTEPREKILSVMQKHIKMLRKEETVSEAGPRHTMTTMRNRFGPSVDSKKFGVYKDHMKKHNLDEPTVRMAHQNPDNPESKKMMKNPKYAKGLELYKASIREEKGEWKTDTGWKKPEPERKDQFGNVIKTKNLAKRLAKMAAKKSDARTNNWEKRRPQDRQAAVDSMLGPNHPYNSKNRNKK